MAGVGALSCGRRLDWPAKSRPHCHVPQWEGLSAIRGNRCPTALSNPDKIRLYSSNSISHQNRKSLFVSAWRAVFPDAIAA